MSGRTVAEILASFEQQRQGVIGLSRSLAETEERALRAEGALRAQVFPTQEDDGEPEPPNLPPRPVSTDEAKADREKPRWDLLPPGPVSDIVSVLSYGAEKYRPNGWQTVPGARRRYLAALLRHLFAHMAGEKVDPESGLTHLSHVACNVVFLLAFERGDVVEVKE